MAIKRQDIRYRGHRIIANAGGAMIYPQKERMDAKSLDEALTGAKAWIDDRYSERASERRAPHIGTVDDYAEALEAEPPNRGQRAMLLAHASADDRRMSATQLADAAGWKSHSSANLHYGKLGQRIAEDIGLTIKGSDNHAWTGALATYDEASSSWELHPELADALDQLNMR